LGQVIALNFGLVHQPPEFDYDFDFDDLPEEIREQLPEDTAEILQMFSEEDLHFLRWRICWQAMAQAKQLPPEEFLNMQKPIWLIRSGRGFGKTLTGRTGSVNRHGCSPASTQWSHRRTMTSATPVSRDLRVSCQ